MRAARLCLLAVGGCAQVLGLDSPKQSQISDGRTPDVGAGSDAALGCRGDNFDDNMIDMVRWAPFTEAGEQVIEQNQRLEILLDNAPGSAYSGLDAVAPLAATDTGVQMQVPQASADDTSEVALVLFLNTQNQLFIGKDNTVLQAVVKTSGLSMRMSVPWQQDDLWFRIERSNTKDVTFSVSRDATTWTTVWATTSDLAAQNLRPEIYAGHYQQVMPAVVAIDNFEILPGTCAP